MKKLIQVVDGEGLEKLIGQRVTFFCINYIYTGLLTGVSENDVLLTEAGIVYETGELNTKDWNDIQLLPGNWYVRTSCIESYGILK